MQVQDLPKTGPVANSVLLDFISGEWLRTYDAAMLYDALREWLRWVLEEYTPEGLTFEVFPKGVRQEHAVERMELEAFQAAIEGDRAYVERVLSLEPERYHKLGDIVLQTGLFFPDLFRRPGADLLADATKGGRSLAVELLREYLSWFKGDESPSEWEAPTW